MTLRSPLAQARGLGSAKEGVHHWKLQRITAIANVPLVIWFIVSIISLSGASYGEAAAWLASPISSTLMILLVISIFYHAALGLQVVIEDYVHGKAALVFALLFTKFACIALAVASVLSVLKIAIAA
ncbi:MAG: succinate dehydrogenase, hydrophobic membrane anchor protein [Pseudomonadota bacterium]